MQRKPTTTPPARAAARRQRRLVCIFPNKAQIRVLAEFRAARRSRIQARVVGVLAVD